MKLDENFTLENDQNSWTLYYEENKGKLNKKGEPIISKNQTYHKNIQHALTAYIDKALKPCESVIEVLDKIQILEENINLMTDKIKLMGYIFKPEKQN